MTCARNATFTPILGSRHPLARSSAQATANASCLGVLPPPATSCRLGPDHPLGSPTGIGTVRCLTCRPPGCKLEPRPGDRSTASPPQCCWLVSANASTCLLRNHGAVLKGTETLDSASRDQFVLVDEAAQDVASSNAQHARNRCVGIRQRDRRPQVDPPVRPLRVVVGDVVAERPVEMTPTEDERPVKAFTSDGADPSFGEGVRPRSADPG